MRLWLFKFTQPDRMLVSARVAGKDKQEACTVMGAFVERPLIAGANVHPEPGTILECMGKVDRAEPGVISIIMTDGLVREVA